MDDLISRQAAITLPVLPKEYREYQTSNLDDAYEQGWNDLQKCIESLPSADVQPVRHGRWIRHTEQKNIFNGKTIECSECGEKYVVQYIEDEKFCRNCGARMDGEDDG